jgi:hypothetical protein
MNESEPKPEATAIEPKPELVKQVHDFYARLATFEKG